MTTDEMRDAIEAVYRKLLPEGAKYPVVLPDGVTPQGWFVAMPAVTEGMPLSEFKAKADEVGRSLVAQLPVPPMERERGTGRFLPVARLNRFARLDVQDRPEVQVKSHGGALMRRPRQFIVHALGWRTN